MSHYSPLMGCSRSRYGRHDRLRQIEPGFVVTQAENDSDTLSRMRTFPLTVLPWAADVDGFDCAVAVAIVGETQQSLAEVASLVAHNGGNAPGVDLQYVLELLRWSGVVFSASSADNETLQREIPQIEVNSSFFVDAERAITATAENIEAGTYALPDVITDARTYADGFRAQADRIRNLLQLIDNAKRAG